MVSSLEVKNEVLALLASLPAGANAQLDAALGEKETIEPATQANSEPPEARKLMEQYIKSVENYTDPKAEYPYDLIEKNNIFKNMMVSQFADIGSDIKGKEEAQTTAAYYYLQLQKTGTQIDYDEESLKFVKGVDETGTEYQAAIVHKTVIHPDGEEAQHTELFQLAEVSGKWKVKAIASDMHYDLTKMVPELANQEVESPQEKIDTNRNAITNDPFNLQSTPLPETIDTTRQPNQR